jgi:CheY-like chemotaxis protein
MNKTTTACKSILVIEDHEDIRESIVDILRSEDYDVYSAANGKEGIELLPSIPAPTLILLDMMMPIMNGWQFLEAQKANARMEDLRVVMVSAVPSSKALFTEEGMAPVEGLLAKPIQLEGLLNVVGKYCLSLEELEETAVQMA